MLIRVYDQLTSGKRVHQIIFVNGEKSIAAPPGLKIDFKDGVENADAWVCWDEEGVWLSSNADVYSPNGYLGKQGREDPLASIADIILMTE